MTDAASSQVAPIERRLRRVNAKTGEIESVKETAISSIAGPIVILGDPGLGKSVLTQRLGYEDCNCYVRAGTFVRSKAPTTFLPQYGGRLIIDGLDEVASAAVGGGVDAVLGQLSAIGNPPFILSSREADWSGAAARVRIEDDYGEPVVVLHLEPFDRNDAATFLQYSFPGVDVDIVLTHLAERGLDEIYGNPLTLRMIGEVARAETTLPHTRAELLERSCAIMLREENLRHQDASHAVRTDEELLLAAGAICASLLLCDRSGVYAGPTARTPDDFLHLPSVYRLPLAEAASDALKTRLFQADGEARFVAAHRVIAEYLGARWLGACFDRGASERRVRSLVSRRGGVPTSLRGLNAWLAHFSSALAPACIAADPYAVLRYGNAETLPLEQARVLLRELAKLSSKDPYFRAEDWSRHPAAGLMRVELKDEIIALLSNDQTHTHLAYLLLEAMTGSAIADVLAYDLMAIVFDPDRTFGARSRAADTLVASGAFSPPQPVVERLLGLGDPASQRLAFELLTQFGLESVPANLAVEVMLAHAGLTVSPINRKQQPEHLLYISRNLFSSLDSRQIHSFLSVLADYAGPLMREGDDQWTKGVIADAARVAIVIALDAEPSVSPAQVWRWLSWLRQYDSHDKEAEKSLEQRIRSDIALTHGIQAEAILSAAADEIRSEVFRLADVSHALVPDEEDVIALIEAFSARSGGAADLEQLRDLVSIARRREGLPKKVRDVAIKAACNDPAFIQDMKEWSKPFTDKYERERKRRIAREEARRQKTYRQIRQQHANHIAEIRAGHFQWLEQPAGVYLGRFSEFRKDDEPRLRVEKFLGTELAGDALDGFMATLQRSDLPSAAEIAQSHAENRYFRVEVPLVCGVAEMLRHGEALGNVPRPILESAYMAWRRQHESNVVGGVEIGPALEAVVLANDADAERFFRASIEPQLRARKSHVYDLYMLTHDRRWPSLAGSLAVEWLIEHADLPIIVETELLDCAVRYGSGIQLAHLVQVSRSRVHASFEALLEALATDFVLDFERARKHLAEAARDNPDLLWRIRQRAAGGRHDASLPLTIAQRAFLVAVFGTSWPKTGQPEGTTIGDTNPWDASDFIERAIYSIAAEPAAEATETLQRLADGASSYVITIRHALALQYKIRRDHEYAPASIDQVWSVTSGTLPETIDDMRAYFGDRVTIVQERMHATNTDMWEAYWDGAKPRSENFCRNRLVEHISVHLPPAIRFEPEMHMPNQKRADIAAIRDAVGLPVEIKGQWHAEVWDAPVEQLAARYTRDWHAEGRGSYIVIWFGDVSGKQLPPHPDGLPAPSTPEELRVMLIDRIPEAMRDVIDVYVVDVTRMR